LGDLVDQAIRQSNKIRECRDSLRGSTQNIDVYLENLKTNWKGPELVWIQQAINEVKSNISKAMSLVENTGQTLINVAAQREEERRQAELLAAQARAEASRKSQ